MSIGQLPLHLQDNLMPRLRTQKCLRLPHKVMRAQLH